MRMPGKCQGCGARVELAFDRVMPPNKYRPYDPDLTLPMAWCDPGSDALHSCRRTDVRSTMKAAALREQPAAMPSPDRTGAEMQERTR